MEIYFKIIETRGRQVLVEKDFDTEEDRHSIGITFFHEGCRVSMKMGFSDEAKRDGAFELVNEEIIGKHLAGVLNVFE